MDIMTDCYVITGPTASGKSALALKMAEKQESVILNADAMQLYKGAPILTACPDREDQHAISHKLYQILEPDYLFSAGGWVDLVCQEIEKILQENKKPIIVGGSGFYILALIEGLSPLPKISSKVREQLEKESLEKPIDVFFLELQQIDTVLANRLHPNDRRRILRGIEVFRETNIPLSEWQKMPKQKTKFSFDLNILIPERESLYQNCDQRFFQMIEKGAIEEVRDLLNRNLSLNSPLRNALGFKEIQSYLEGKLGLEEAITLSQTKTRQFAKRQITWMKHQFSAFEADCKTYEK